MFYFSLTAKKTDLVLLSVVYVKKKIDMSRFFLFKVYPLTTWELYSAPSCSNKKLQNSEKLSFSHVTRNLEEAA